MTTNTEPYLRPPWGARVIGNRMARIFARNIVCTLAVQGRRTGRWQRIPVVVLEHGGQRYLIAPRGHTEWSRNLAATGTGKLIRRQHTERFRAVEVPPADRPPLIETYLEQFGRFPTVTEAFRALPDPADHPTFRIVTEQETRRPGDGDPMSVELNHTIVPARDEAASAAFLADILGLTVAPVAPPFVPIELANGVTLDYMRGTDPIASLHYAFLLSDAEFDAAFGRIRAAGLLYWADPGHQQPGQINTRWGGRGLYFNDPDGHNMEILTRAPGRAG